MKYPERLNLKVTTEVKEKLLELSAADERPLMAYIRRVLEQHIKEKEVK